MVLWVRTEEGLSQALVSAVRLVWARDVFRKHNQQLVIDPAGLYKAIFSVWAFILNQMGSVEAF